MKRKYSNINDPANAMHQVRNYIIHHIEVYDEQNNVRNLLDQALNYSNKVSEEPMEYQERDLKRILVNHIRHRRSTYESHLKQINLIDRYTNNSNYSYRIYKNAVLDSIAEQYPYLSSECNKQKYKGKFISQ